ncbi:hypothetical protein A2U01_0073183, partial [Trifolium medium]|nr:hypothetical protein [Trifolium medium]
MCQRLHVPTEDDEIAIPLDPLSRVFFRRALGDLEAATTAPQPPPPAPHHQQHQQHQVPPHISQQHQYSDYELGMAATVYEQHYRMDWGLPHFSPPLMA